MTTHGDGKPHILYNALGFDGGKSGISVYMRETIAALGRIGRVTVITTPADLPLLPTGPGIDFKVLPRVVQHPVAGMLWSLFLLPFQVKPKRYDALFLAAANRRAVWFTRGLFTVALVHDLSQFHIDAKYDFFRMIYVKHLLPAAVRRADRVVAISRSTASDLERFWKIDPARILINYNGFDRETFRPDIPLEKVAEVRERYGLEEEYLLYISRIEHPGKNHLRLIQAFEKLPEHLRRRYQLVLGGSAWMGADTVFRYAADSPDTMRVRFIGFVPTKLLPPLYKGARLYVFPSLFEGFGLSIPEAMACGTPVVCSNNSSLGEIAGDAAIQFDPFDVDSITAALRRALEDEAAQSECRRHVPERLQLFNWELHAAKIAACCLDRFAARNRVLGVTYDNLSMEEALDRIVAAAAGETPRMRAAFINADCLNQAFANPRYRKLLDEFSPVMADGSGIACAGRMLHAPVRDNVNGTDMLPLLCDRLAAKGLSLFLYGARPGVARQAADRLTAAHPGLRIAGIADGFQPEGAVLEAIRRAAPDLLLVAKGVPLQEEFIAAHFEELACRAALGVGGLFDFYSGNMPRAPRWLRRVGMEWIFRLAMEPRRMFKRYVIGNPLFLWRVFRYGENGHA